MVGEVGEQGGVVTLGVFGFGQLIDLFLIPGMIERANLKSAAW